MTYGSAGRRLALNAGLALLVGGLLSPSASQAAARHQGAAAVAVSAVTAANQPCVTIDGTTANALRTGASPVRFKYSGSPYLGVRFNSCGQTIRLYYGGFSGLTHYNIRLAIPNQGQIEVGPGLRRVLTRNVAGYGTFAYAVQGCQRGGLFQSSSCTRWSPTVSLFVPRQYAGS